MVVAIREYELDGFQCVDTLRRLTEHSYRLEMRSCDPQERDTDEELCEIAAYRWMRECPYQLTYRRAA